VSFPYERLRRWPDLESPELVAYDSADKLLIEHAQLELPQMSPAITQVTILGDTHGALALSSISELSVKQVLLHQDNLSGEAATLSNARELSDVLSADASLTHLDLSPELFSSSRLVLMRLPKSLEQLDQWAAMIAAYAPQDVVVVCAGRIKYMTLSMNEVLGRYFTSVQAHLAQHKSRALTVRGPRRQEAEAALSLWPKSELHQDLDMTVCAHGGVFAGTSIDIGTYDLLAVLDRVSGRQQQRIIDFGCGSGVLAAQIARLRPTATVIATDQSWAAVHSTQATINANGLEGRVTVVRDDGLATQPDASADLILFNPPFHSGAAVHAGTSLRLFAEAGRVLVPGGELWVVANRHLSYKPALRKLVGETREVRRTPKFTVTKSIKGDK
jgi:16S rRNA (guanine1207-N2)-methyltransferase